MSPTKVSPLSARLCFLQWPDGRSLGVVATYFDDILGCSEPNVRVQVSSPRRLLPRATSPTTISPPGDFPAGNFPPGDFPQRPPALCSACIAARVYKRANIITPRRRVRVLVRVKRRGKIEEGGVGVREVSGEEVFWEELARPPTFVII